MSGRPYKQCVPRSTSRGLERNQALRSGKDMLGVINLPIQKRRKKKKKEREGGREGGNDT